MERSLPTPLEVSNSPSQADSMSRATSRPTRLQSKPPSAPCLWAIGKAPASLSCSTCSPLCFPQIPNQESGVSQIFLTIDPTSFGDLAGLNAIADGILGALGAATPVDPNRPVRYPGQQTLQLREENRRLGVPVTPEIWTTLNTLAFPGKA
jgi:hypothetical protein